MCHMHGVPVEARRGCQMPGTEVTVASSLVSSGYYPLKTKS